MLWSVYMHLLFCLKELLNLFFEEYCLINDKNYVPGTLEIIS